MTASASDRRPSRHWVRWLLLLGLLLALAAIVHISSGIVRESRNHDLYPAGAIVVFGAAQYDGRPSPVFRARLDHAFDLFQRGLAPVVIITGGFASDPRFSEGGVGHDYLMHRGVSEARLIAETCIPVWPSAMPTTSSASTNFWSTKACKCRPRLVPIPSPIRSGSAEWHCCGSQSAICSGACTSLRNRLSAKSSLVIKNHMEAHPIEAHPPHTWSRRSLPLIATRIVQAGMRTFASP